MKHRCGYRQLGRDVDSRKALLRSLATSMIESGKIRTTLAKAKELRKIIEKMITMAREDNFNNRRRIRQFVYSDQAVTKLFGEIAVRYKERNGGYTRILKLGERQGDDASMSIIEFV